MNLMEELNSLDPRDPGRWPLPIRLGAVAIWFVLLTFILSYVLVWNKKRPELDARQAEERTLREEFGQKHSKAVNLEVYKQQLKDIERSFGALLRRLPGKTEVDKLLVDISQSVSGAGLDQRLFEPESEQMKDFYAEKPIKIRIAGNYHQFGDFVSAIAALPRIVTLHDIEIKSDSKDVYDQLTLDLTAKTYRYLDEDELAAAESAKQQEQVTRRPGAGG